MISFSGSLLLAYKNDTAEGVENELTHNAAWNVNSTVTRGHYGGSRNTETRAFI